MIDRLALETAITELDTLLANDNADECAYQAWFEKHDIVFDACGYRRWIPHPRITHGSEILIPDFIAERLDGLWEFLELKRPDTKVLKDRTRRQSFYASLEEYYAQCREYSLAIHDERVRSALNDKYAFTPQRDVPAVLIAGRRQHVDLRRVHSILFDRGGKVAFQTYDDIRTRLEFLHARSFAQQENISGFSIHMLIAPGRVPRQSNYIADFGVATDRNRLSIFIDDHDCLCFRILDSTGTPYTTRVALAEASVTYESRVYLVFELGLAPDYSFLCIEVNGNFYADRRVDRMDIALSELRHIVLGSDVLGRAHTEMLLFEKIVCARTLTFHEKSEMRTYMFERYFNRGGTQHRAVHFSGNQSMHTHEHPNFPGEGKSQFTLD